ncbi:UNVERIFIED_CONTAM: TetR/AcrR family transcriptional repressor of nem operon [Brevibacillus sp. OAP136]
METVSTSGRPREFKDTAVIDAAMDVFWSNGYEACSTQELCERTGLGRGSLYNAFGSKHELYEQALQRYHEQGIAAQLDILNRPIAVKDRLRGLLEWAVAADFSSPDRRGCFAINAALERACKDPMVEKVFTRHVERLEKAICGVIKSGQESGEIAADRSSGQLAALFLSSYYGLRVLNTGTQNRQLAEQIIAGALDAIF